MNELEVLKKALPEMVSIMNALPGERFDMKSAQTILNCATENGAV